MKFTISLAIITLAACALAQDRPPPNWNCDYCHDVGVALTCSDPSRPYGRISSVRIIPSYTKIPYQL